MSNWKEIVKSVAPVLGTALGGPMAGAAIKTLGSILLPGEPSPTERQIEQSILQSHPDQLVSIKEADHRFEIQMKELDVDVFGLEVSDRDSARRWHHENHMPAIICILLTAMVGAGAHYLMTSEIPERNENILYMLFGNITTAWLSSIAYWVGTTKGSKDKTNLMKAR